MSGDDLDTRYREDLTDLLEKPGACHPLDKNKVIRIGLDGISVAAFEPRPWNLYSRRSVLHDSFIVVPPSSFQINVDALKKTARKLEEEGVLVPYGMFKDENRGVTVWYIIGLPECERDFELQFLSQQRQVA